MSEFYSTKDSFTSRNVTYVSTDKDLSHWVQFIQNLFEPQFIGWKNKQKNQNSFRILNVWLIIIQHLCCNQSTCYLLIIYLIIWFDRFYHCIKLHELKWYEFNTAVFFSPERQGNILSHFKATVVLPWWVTIKRCSSWIFLPFISLCKTWAETIFSSWDLKTNSNFSTHIFEKKLQGLKHLVNNVFYLQIVSVEDSSVTGFVNPGLTSISILICCWWPVFE